LKNEEEEMGSITKRRWLEEGLAILEEEGAEALTIEALTGRLAITKGSFYHHFTNYQNFKEHLLIFFEEERTLRIIHLAEQALFPHQKLERVLQATLKPSHLEVAIRAWALQDAFVRDYQQRIDQQRLTYLEEVAYAQSGDRLYATQMAKVFYSIYVGSQHIIPPIQSTELEQLYQQALQWFRLMPMSGLDEHIQEGSK
jgi:AcrR family transcriptional regulator